MADIQTQLPVKLTNNTNTAGITASNALQVDLSQTAANSTPIVVAGAGTAGTPGTAVLTIQGVGGGTAVPISGTVTANAGTGNFNVVGTLTNNNAAPAANNVGSLVALCTTAAPTWTTGNQTLLSVDTSGNLRVSVSSTTGTSNVNLTQVGGSAISLGQKTMANSLPVVISSDQSNVNTAIIAQQSAATSGTITTSTSTVSVATTGYNAVTVTVNGTYAGVNFTFEASDDGGTTYYTVAAARLDNSAVNTTTGVITNQSAMWTAYLGATTNFRVRATAYTSGTANIKLTPTVIGVSPAVIATVSSGSTNITQIAGNAVTTATAGMQKVGIADSSGNAITLGQTTMANSLPVTIASNQSAITVAQSTASSLNATVVGNLTNNNAAPSTNNVGALVAVATTAAPTYTTGNLVALSTDTSGNLRVSVSSTSGTSNVNLTQVGGSAIALGQTTMSASLPVTIASNQSAITVAQATAANLNATVVGTLTNNNAAPAATNFGVLPALVGSAAPTWTSGNQSLLSVDTSGNLRVSITASSATQATNITQIAGSSVTTATTGMMKVGIADSAGSSITLGQKTMANSVPVVIASDQSNVNTAMILQQATATTGTITTSTSTVAVAMAGYTGVTVTISGTYAGINFTFEASDDGGTTYYTVAASRSDNSAIQTSTGVITANSSIMWDVYTGAVTNFRVRATAYTSGTGNIRLTPVVVSQDPAIIASVSGTINTNLTQVAGSAVTTATTGMQKVGIADSSGSAITLGQTVMASSLPVTIASNQSAITVAQSTAANLNATVVGSLTNNNAAPSTNNVGSLVALCTTAAPTWTTGNQTLLSVDTSGNLRVSVSSTSGTSNVNLTQVGGSAIALGQTTMSASLPVAIASNQSTLNTQGTLTNNNAAPSTNNVGVLPALVGSAAPSYTSGNQALLSVDTAGNLRTINTGPSTGVVTSYTNTTSVAAGSTGTATYTVTAGKTLHLTQVIASSSGGPCRVQVDYGAGPTIIFVGFYASSSPFLTVNFATPVLIAASTAVNVKIQNNAGASQDVYATICGFEI